MKICDLLTEAPKDELALQQLARAVLKYIIDAIASDNMTATRNGRMMIPNVKLGEILPKGSWGAFV